MSASSLFRHRKGALRCKIFRCQRTSDLCERTINRTSTGRMLSIHVCELHVSWIAQSMHAKLTAPVRRSLHSTQPAWSYCGTLLWRLVFRFGYFLSSTISGTDGPWHAKSLRFPDTFRNEDNNSGRNSRYIPGIVTEDRSNLHGLQSTRHLCVFWYSCAITCNSTSSWYCRDRVSSCNIQDVSRL